MKKDRRKLKFDSKYTKVLVAFLAFVLSFSMLSQSIVTNSEEDNTAAEETNSASMEETVQTPEETAAVETDEPELQVNESPAVETIIPSEETAEPVQSEQPEVQAAETIQPLQESTVVSTAEPEEYFEQKLEFDDEYGNHVNVSVTAADGVFSSGTTVSIQRVTASDDIYQKISDAVNQKVNDREVTGSVLYAFTFKDSSGNETEPNGMYSIRMDWSNVLRPEETKDSTAAFLQVKKAEDTDDYTAEDLLQNAAENAEQQTQVHAETAILNQDVEGEIDENDIHCVDITSDHSGVFALTWTKEFTVTVHYQDETYHDISASDVIPVSQEMSSDSLIKEIDNYSVLHTYMDSADITGLKVEEGKLYFNNGTDWVETENRDVYLIYEQSPVETQMPAVTAEPTETPETSPSAEPAEQAPVLVKSAGNYTVSVSYDETSGLPDGTDLEVTELEEDSDAYQNALEKVAAEKGVSEDSFTMAALDISLKDKDNNEVEPEDDSKVKVKITLKDLPEDAENIEIHHIVTKNTNDESNTTNESAARRLFRAVRRLAVNNKPEETAEDVKAVITEDDNGETSAEFETDHFSVFTITWTKGDGTRTGNVVLHYIDANGLEHDLKDATSISAENLAKQNGGIVILSEYAKDLKTDDDGTQYTYDHSVIGDRKGTTITGLKIASSTETKVVAERDPDTGEIIASHNVDVTVYKLYYTTDSNVTENSNWIEYKDSAGSSDASNADIYLAYKANVSSDPSKVTIHHVDTYGAQLKTEEFDLFGFTKNNDGKTSNIINFTDRWNGSSYSNRLNKSYFEQKAESNIGTYSKSYIGIFNNEKYLGNRGLFYKKDSSTGIWHTGTGDMQTVNEQPGANVTTELYDQNNNPVLYTDVYLVYSGKKGTTIHYIDENGNKIADDTGTATEPNGTFTALTYGSSIEGYSYKEAHIGSATGNVFTTIQYTQSGNEWSSIVKNGEEAVSADSPVNEVWLVYSPSEKLKTFTVKYKYIDQNDNEADTNTNDKTFTLSSSDSEKYLDNTGTEGNLVQSNVTKKSNNGSLIYLATRLGSAHGPTVTSVYVDNNGNAIYHYQNTRTMTYQRRNQWNLADSSTGRNFTLYLDSNGNYSLNDSQHGTIDLNKSRDAADTSDIPKQEDTFLDSDNITDLYTATFHGEAETTKYTIAVIGDLYNLTVEDWMPSENTTIYETYINGSDDEDKIWIEDDLKYSGYFKVGMSTSLSSKISSASTFTWHRVVTTTASDGTKSTDDTVVARKQTYDHWNIASAPRNRTWLDIEADESDEGWTLNRSVAYYVVVTYPETAGDTTTTKEVKSDTIAVRYYGELENGSFENDPNEAGNATTYSQNGGVWKTTANDNAIEIVNGIPAEDNNLGGSGGYNWAHNDPSFNAQSKTSVARDQKYFAELNANQAGALYQDVITHPNETLSYGLSHRARGSDESNQRNDCKNYQYDTMYLVIMPTKLAMTGSSDGTELKDQQELQNFINNHGGFDSTPATGIEDKVTYRDTENGILIRKISSGMNAWHDISATNGYIAKGGLTRFFFVAASTAGDYARALQYPNTHANDPPTLGNFLDRVYFSQDLPETDGFNLTVTETFSGLTQEELAGLATNAASVEGVTPQKNALQVRLSDANMGTGNAIDALNGATLGFTVTHTGNGYTFTPTATIKSGSNDIDLLTASAEINKTGTTNVRTNVDGSVTMTWTFPDQDLKSGADDLSDGRFRYSAVDSVEGESNPTVFTTEVAGYSLTRSRTTEGGEEGSGTSNAVVTRHTSATINIVNTYAKNPHISVRKTFSGVTPSTVQEIMNNGYSISVTDRDATESKVLKATGNASDVEVSSSTDANGNTVYIWEITDPDWLTGTYEVSESGYETTRNELETITLNGTNIAEDIGDKKQWPSTTQTVTINNNTAGTLSYAKADVKSAANVSYENLGSNINLIVAQYGTESDIHYIVWTEDTIGLITRNAILNKINSDDAATGLVWTNKTEATRSNTSFYSGLNNGATSITLDDHTMQFDGMNLTLSGSDGNSWNEYYATNYYVTANRGLENDSEIRITNEYMPKLKIQKQSSKSTESGESGQNKKLSGAKFRIYQKNTDGSKMYYQGDNKWKATGESNNPKTYITGTDGLIELDELSVNNEDETYFLEEYEAPAGYNRISDIEFRVKANGTVVLLNGDTETTAIGDKVQLVFIDPYYTFIINDDPGFILPDTGGIGTKVFQIAGGILITAAAMLVIKRKAGDHS